ncbi:phage major capsid protein [Mycobacterium sp. SMC-2]|uniref:phage major capsid protein n=1 Tax=Mycobacterium sp. SMC-2 TaxID=2857058 RepID=UPI0021B34FB6|nr:phage major capsid protein [Mycobacterium sp. SMC-2]UXA08679.1 phage major capsid protein [Mycobacterium sp. SMC-2]
MTIEVPSGNSALLQSQIADLIVQPLLERSTFLSAGPTIIDSHNSLRIPRISSPSTANFVAPGTQISDGSVSFDEVDLLPTSLESLKVLVKVSNELVRQSAIALNAVLQNRIVNDVALALDAALWNGSGSSNTIKGILQTSGVATGTLDLTTPDSLIDGMNTALANFVQPTHWVMRPDVYTAFRKLKAGTSDARYLFNPSDAYAANSYNLVGLPVIITSHVPDNTVALVDFSHVVVARDLDTEVRLLLETFGDYDSVGIRVVTRYDVALTQPHAVTLLTTA